MSEFADAYDSYLRALDDEVAREKEARDGGPSLFTALLDASERATRRQIREMTSRESGECA
jgi:hypothetical protein